MPDTASLPQLQNDQPIPPAYAAHFPPGYLEGNRGPIILKGAIFFMALDTVMTSLRFWARWIQRSSLRADDYLVIMGLLFCWGLDASYICSVLLGHDGRRMDYIVIYPERFAAHQKTTWLAAPLLFLVASAMSKLAVLYVYHSIFVNKVDLLGCKIVGVFIILSTLAEVPISVFQCTPVHGLWELNVTAKCIDKAAFIRYGPIPNMLTDIALMVLPIRTIRTIQVPLRVKIGIFITFLMGSIGLLVCIARFIVLFQPVSDSSWQGVPVNLCTMAEATTYLMSACLLQIRPLLTFLFRETPLSKLRNWNLTHTASRLNVIETGHQKRSRHASHIGMHSLGKPSSKDSTPLTNKDGITITNEFTVAYERGILDEDHSYERSRSTSTIDPTEQV